MGVRSSWPCPSEYMPSERAIAPAGHSQSKRGGMDEDQGARQIGTGRGSEVRLCTLGAQGQPRSLLEGYVAESRITLCRTCHRQIHLRAETLAQSERVQG